MQYESSMAASNPVATASKVAYYVPKPKTIPPFDESFREHLRVNDMLSKMIMLTTDNFGIELVQNCMDALELAFNQNAVEGYSVSCYKMNASSGTPLAKVEGLQGKISNILPMSTYFGKDQNGFSNLTNPDGVWAIDVEHNNDITRVPIFVEIDNGSETKKQKETHTTTMKMYHSVSAGHLMEHVNEFVVTLRINLAVVKKDLLNRQPTRHDKNKLLLANTELIAR